MVTVAAIIAVAATVAVHLGLLEAIARVARMVARCGMCSTFWLTMAALIARGENVAEAALVSIVAAYASLWIAEVLKLLQKLYDRVWRRKK